MSTKHRPARQRGLSLVELIMFIVIISIGVVSIVRVMGLTASNSSDPLRRKQALMIAESLIEEVELARFTYCDPADANAETASSTAGCATTVENVGPEAGNARPYDNVNDYVAVFGATENPFNNAGVLVDANNVAMTLGGNAGNAGDTYNYAATLAIVPEALGGIASVAAPATMQVLRMTVTVRYGPGVDDTIVLEGYRTRHSPNSL